MDQGLKGTLLLLGLGVMVGTAISFIAQDDLNGRQIFGFAVLFIIGFGMTVAGSPDPKKKED